jgi:hypothetical protein
VLTLKTAWADGTCQLVLEPVELLEKLAALIPRPRIDLVLYHGVLAPHCGWRARVVAYGAPPAEVPVVANGSAEASDEPMTAPVCRGDLGRGRRRARAGGSGAAVRTGTDHQPRCGDRDVSVIRTPRFAELCSFTVSSPRSTP